MELNDLVDSIPGFSKWTDADKIRLFAWFIHSKRGRERFSPADLRRCYDDLNLQKPKDVNPYLNRMLTRKPKEVLRDSRGYALEKRVRDDFDKKYGQRSATAQADKLLLELPSKLPNLAERTFLDEAIICFRHKAFRASIVMTWNLAYDHLCRYILNKHLVPFNGRMPIRFPNLAKKTGITTITNRDDFAELKESEVIEICRSANIITADVYKILDTKLGIRNTAAHPSTVVISPHTAEEYIIDLVTNVVLKLI